MGENEKKQRKKRMVKLKEAGRMRGSGGGDIGRRGGRSNKCGSSGSNRGAGCEFNMSSAVP